MIFGHNSFDLSIASMKKKSIKLRNRDGHNNEFPHVPSLPESPAGGGILGATITGCLWDSGYRSRRQYIMRSSMFTCIRRCLISSYSRILFYPSCQCSTQADAFRIQQFTEKYLNNRKATFTETLEIVDPYKQKVFPIYRVTDSKGQFIDNDYDPGFTKELALKIYQYMITVHITDKILNDSQRQGRIPFYATSVGEEALQIGSALGLEDDDLIYGQYREIGALLWRGFSLEDYMNQCYGNAKDMGVGKQMPMHYGSAEKHFVTISSPLATQIPQAVGSAYAFKRENSGRVVLVYFGEGAASEGDAHGAMNMASTLKCPVIFFCRNNGYAISTPCSEQYGGDGIAGRAIGYGIHTIRVDGNDLFAVYNVTKAARELAQQNKPVLIEAMTYRLGHHSTSDDSTSYRSSEEVKLWNDNENPINRFRTFLENKGWWSDDEDVNLQQNVRKEILKKFSNAEKILKPNVMRMFEDVYKEMPGHLEEQRQELYEHLKNYGQHYPLEKFEPT